MEAPEVTVEVHLGNGLPSVSLVGLPDTEVKEARDRVRAALLTSQFEFPQRRVTVSQSDIVHVAADAASNIRNCCPRHLGYGGRKFLGAVSRIAPQRTPL